MTTDTALGVTKLVVQDKGQSPISDYKVLEILTYLLVSVPLGDIPYVVCIPLHSYFYTIEALRTQDYPTIRFNANESVEMPFSKSSLSISLSSAKPSLMISSRVYCKGWQRANTAGRNERAFTRGS